MAKDRTVVFVSALFAVIGAGAGVASPPAPATAPAPATYHVKMLGVTPPRLAVTASLPITGRTLAMDTTRPAGIPELDAGGWPALVTNLRVTDSAGQAIEATSTGEGGWQLTQPLSGRVMLAYEVDYGPLAARGWPAPREAAVADDGHLVFVGRSIFITTADVRESAVSFDLEKGWRPVTAWKATSGSAKVFAVSGSGELVENLLVFSRSAPEVVTAGGLRVLAVPMGQWLSARKEVRRVLGAVIPPLVQLMGVKENENYLVVLLPVVERGGESYRHSFALTVETPPSRANSAIWGNTIAHEIFHLWNGWRLQGSDYATSQWFQEGLTEYAANLSMVAANLIDQEQFLQKLSDHVLNYRKLATTLEAGGTHKGPPLYSGGALVAFSWDVLIRRASEGQRGFGDFLAAFWKQTDQGRRSYAWSDIQAALTATVALDWEAFYRAYIRGAQPLPLDQTFGRVGVYLMLAADDTPRLTFDPMAPETSKALWQALVDWR